MTDDEKFREWLKGEGNQPFILQNGDYSYVYLKVPRTSKFDYLYRQQAYKTAGLARNSSLEYVGIYNKLNDTIYDYRNYYNLNIPKNVYRYSVSEMSQKLKESVVKEVESKIADNRENLSISILTADAQKKLEKFKEFYLEKEIRQKFLALETSKDIKYECQYSFDKWKDEDLLEYILNPEKFIELQANNFISVNQEQILLQFEESDLIKEGLQELEALDDGVLHRKRNIKWKMLENSAKTVNVTIERNGQKFTFKMEAEALRRDSCDSYSSWNIVSKDRAEFERLFGRHESFYPEEITEISYCGKLIYSEEPLETPTATQGLKLT